MDTIKNCNWIWADGVPLEENYYIDIRKSCYVDRADPKARLSICVDTDYCLWLNNIFVNCGQFGDLPDYRHYDVLDIGQHLMAGDNILTLTCYHQGRDSSRYRVGKPGVIFMLENNGQQIQSDLSCKVRVSKTFKNAAMPVVTPMLGFTMEYNASYEDGWREIEYNDVSWKNAINAGVNLSELKHFEPRPLPKLNELPALPLKIVKHGTLKRFKNDGSYAAIMASDSLHPSEQQAEPNVLNAFDESFIQFDPHEIPSNNIDGFFLLLDTGFENFGYFHIDVDAEEGAVFDFAHGEHIHDGFVRYYFGGDGEGEGSIERNFADRYICRQGRQQWTMRFRRLGGRYIQLHVTNVKSEVKIYYAGIKPVEYPLNSKGRFEVPDKVHERILRTCDRTLRLCMHEHYEDTPWREQALYAMDGRIQALCGYYLYGEYDLPRESIRLLGRNRFENGYLELTSPGRTLITIPCFSLVWILMLKDHYMFTGNDELIDEFLLQVKEMTAALAEKLKKSGLFPVEQDRKYWNFYEWSPGLDEKGAVLRLRKGRYHFCFDAFLLKAIETAVWLCNKKDDTELDHFKSMLPTYRDTINETYFDNQRGLYKNYPGHTTDEPFNQLTQGLALYCDLAQGHRAEQVSKAICKDNSLAPATLSMLYYVFEGLLKTDPENCNWVYRYIAKTWGFMLKKGATSFWETMKGQADFDGAGSLCHGWSAVPVYCYFKYILGVSPVKPGFSEFNFEPLPSDLRKASGTIPTPHGVIEVNWQIKKDGNNSAELKYPQQLQMTNQKAIEKKWKFKKATI